MGDDKEKFIFQQPYISNRYCTKTKIKDSVVCFFVVGEYNIKGGKTQRKKEKKMNKDLTVGEPQQV